MECNQTHPTWSNHCFVCSISMHPGRSKSLCRIWNLIFDQSAISNIVPSSIWSLLSMILPLYALSGWGWCTHHTILNHEKALAWSCNIWQGAGRVCSFFVLKLAVCAEKSAEPLDILWTAHHSSNPMFTYMQWRSVDSISKIILVSPWTEPSSNVKLHVPYCMVQY